MKNYVMDQTHAKAFVVNLLRLIEQVVPAMLEAKTTNTVTIAIGCTGGQHRSVAVAEELSDILSQEYPHYNVSLLHRELDLDCEPAAGATAGDHRQAWWKAGISE